MIYSPLIVAAATLLDPTDIASDPAFPQFAQFVAKHRGGTPYHDELETLGRFSVFKQTLARIDKLNSQNGRTEKHGVTQFADLTPQEFRAKYMGAQPTTDKLKKRMPMLDHKVAANVSASSVNWRTRGALTPIKNQGQCGSCWAFSATEQLESDYFLKYGVLKTLSPQQITSCTTTCAGCGGGNPINAWAYVNSFGGQELNLEYPYVSGVTGQTGTCASAPKEVTEDVGTALGYMISQAPSQEANMLKQIELSPMSIIVDATLWQTYSGGVITASSGCGTSLDHAVQAVGYAAEGNYWIIRNSWGSTWGEEGNVYVEYGHNVCGLTAQATITDPTKIALDRHHGKPVTNSVEA